MNHTTKKFLSNTMIVACSLGLFGCSTAVNPWYDKTPQKSQSYSKRKAVRDNAFIESGGLVKKSKVNPFVSVDSAQMTKDGFYSTNQGLKPINKKSGVYQNPLGEPAYLHKPKEQPKAKGSESSISGFFKKLNIFSKNSDKSQSTNTSASEPSTSTSSEASTVPTQSPASYQTSSINFDQKSNEQSGVSVNKRLPIANQLALKSLDQSKIDEELYTTVEQGGGDTAGYNHYDLAKDLVITPGRNAQEAKLETLGDPTQGLVLEVPKKIMLEGKAEPQDLKQPYIENMVGKNNEMIGPMQINKVDIIDNTKKSGITISEYAEDEAKRTAQIFQANDVKELSEFDSYYVEQNKEKPTFKSTVQNYLKGLSGALNPVNNAYANENFRSVDTQHANLRDTEANNLITPTAEETPTPIITDESMRATEGQHQDLKDVPTIPEKLQEQDQYQDNKNNLQEDN